MTIKKPETTVSSSSSATSEEDKAKIRIEIQAPNGVKYRYDDKIAYRTTKTPIKKQIIPKSPVNFPT